MRLLQRRIVDLQIVNKTSVRERKVPKAAKMEVKSHLSTLTSVMELHQSWNYRFEVWPAGLAFVQHFFTISLFFISGIF